MENNIKTFKARWSIFVWIITIIFGYLAFVATPVWMYEIIIDSSNDSNNWYLLPLALVLISFLSAVFFAPMKYSITDSNVVVHRLGLNVAISITRIFDVKQIQRRELGFLPLRLFGVGGFCGGYGIFFSSRLGLFKAYITNTKTLILITYDENKKILLSPEKPQEFLDTLAQAKYTNMN